MQGKGFDDNVKEKILAELAAGTSVSDLARRYKIAKSTISGWKKALHNPGNEQKLDEFEQLRTEKKKEFIKGAWELIDDSLAVAKTRMSRARRLEQNIDILVEAIKKNNGEITKDTGLAWFDLLDIIKELHSLKNPKLSEISTLIGTIYDKQAVASNEATAKTEHSVTIEDYVKDIQGAKY